MYLSLSGLTTYTTRWDTIRVAFFQDDEAEITYRRPAALGSVTRSIMKFGYTILYVEDVAATLSFYQQAFGLTPRFLHESGGYGELETGATALAFASREMLRQMHKNPRPPSPDAPSFEIALTTDNVAEALKRSVDAGAKLVQDANVMPWGQTIAYVRDLNDFLIEICTPMG